MWRMIKCLVFICVMMLWGLKPVASVQCSQSASKCFPIHGSEIETMCVLFFNGTGLDWFQAKSKCEADGGRLAHIGNYSDESGLITTASRQMSARHVRVGVMTSVRGDEMTFMTNTSELKCTSKMSQQCSSTTSPSECNALGCCFHGCICQYPENQFVASVDLNYTRLPGPIATERYCVQLNNNNTWSPFNCSEPGGIATAYACERKCSANWPLETYQNATWSSAITSSPLMPKCTTPMASPYASGNTSTAMYHQVTDGAKNGGTAAPGLTSTGVSPYVSGIATAGLVSHSVPGDTSAKIQNTTASNDKESSTEQNVACQFNVQVLWLVILMTMSTVHY